MSDETACLTIKTRSCGWEEEKMMNFGGPKENSGLVKYMLSPQLSCPSQIFVNFGRGLNWHGNAFMLLLRNWNEIIKAIQNIALIY